MKKPIFYLEKWYLDVVDSNHNSSIFYAARLKWFGVGFQYVDWIYFDGDEVQSQSTNFRNVSMPKQLDNIITWEDKKLNVKGEWTSMEPPIQALVFDSPKGQLDWQCYQPRSRVKLKINGKETEGLGYSRPISNSMALTGTLATCGMIHL